MIATVIGASPGASGFLVPADGAVGAEFTLRFESFAAEQYAQQYVAEDGRKLLISEHADTAGASFRQQAATFARMAANRHGAIPRKLRDIAFAGRDGALYEMTNVAPRALDLLYDDDGKLLRISAYDGPARGFAPDDLIRLLARFERRG